MIVVSLKEALMKFMPLHLMISIKDEFCTKLFDKRVVFIFKKISFSIVLILYLDSNIPLNLFTLNLEQRNFDQPNDEIKEVKKFLN